MSIQPPPGSQETTNQIKTTMNNLTILTLGPRATFSHAAAKKVARDFGLNAEIIFRDTNFQVCASLAKGDGDIAVVPMENNAAGLVPDWINWCIRESIEAAPRAEIIGELVCEINQCLMVKPGVKKGQIRKVVSHERAIRQCTLILGQLDVPAEEVSSTAEAARLVSESASEDGYAALAPIGAAEEFGLEILELSAEDNPGNVTRFGILRRKDSAVIEKTSAIIQGNDRKRVIAKFGIPNVAGSLHKITSVLLVHDADMTSLRDLPQGAPFAFNSHFYLEFEIDKDKVESCIQALGHTCHNLKIFGNFFIGEKKVQFLNA